MMTKLLSFKPWSALLFMTAILSTNMLGQIVSDSIMIPTYAALLVLLFFLLAYMITDKVLFKKSISSFELLILALCIVPIQAGITAQLHFGQPWLYGFLSLRGFYFILWGLVVYYALLWNKVSLQSIEAIFLKASWFILVAYYTIYFISPNDQSISAIGHSEIKGDVMGTPTKLFTFAAIYYFVKLCKNLRLSDIISFLMFFSYLVFIRKGRTVILITLLACIIFFIKHTTIPRKIVYFAMAIVTGLTIWLLILIISPHSFDFIAKMYAAAFTVVFTGEESQDASASARLYEASIAMEWISRNPWFGNGNLSNQWHGGFEIFGHFYPSDIGIIGVVFIMGILGTILVLSQFLYAYYISHHISPEINSQPFILACKFTLLAFFIQTAHALYFAGANMIFVAVLAYVYHSYPRVRHASNHLYIPLSIKSKST